MAVLKHHALLVDEHRRFFIPSLLGEQVLLCRREERQHPSCRERVPGRDLYRIEKLGRESVSQTDSLQPA